jgi:hypothetical protein
MQSIGLSGRGNKGEPNAQSLAAADRLWPQGESEEIEGINE